jgi:hypothetical protein
MKIRNCEEFFNPEMVIEVPPDYRLGEELSAFSDKGTEKFVLQRDTNPFGEASADQRDSALRGIHSNEVVSSLPAGRHNSAYYVYLDPDKIGSGVSPPFSCT